MSSRINRRQLQKQKIKKRKRKLFFSFLLTFAILFVATASYAMFQFEAGRQDSLNNLATNEKNEQIGNEVEVKEPENDEPINVLLIGVDTEKNEPARTDTILIAQYDPIHGEAKLASIMRDTYVEIPGRSNNKINAAFAFGGAELLRETIEHNFDLDIHYYAMVNFDGFVQVVDTIAPDGLEVDIEKRMYYVDKYAGLTIDFQPGLQRLNGEQTLKYVRFRNDAQNDFGRVQRQQEVLTLLKEELLSLSGLSRIPRIIGAVEPHIDTNIKTAKLISLGKDFVLNPATELQTMRIPVEGSYRNKSYSHAGTVLEIDFEENRKAIQQFFKQSTDDSETTVTMNNMEQ